MSRSGSSDDSGNDPDAWVLYRDRPEWADVTPIPQDDGPNPVVQIAYSEKFKDIYDYFRAVLKSGEKSERVLELTEDALDLNAGNYTVWYYRREVLKAMNSNYADELRYSKEMIEEHPKNYQVWQHRRALVEETRQTDNELSFIAEILEKDEKNYHAWQHRQWVVKEFGLWQNELEYVDTLLGADIRNNSAWNQRFFVVTHNEGWPSAVADRETSFSLEMIRKVTRNESAWNYLRGVLENCDDISMKKTLVERVKGFCEELLSSGNNSACLLGFMVELLQQDLENSKEGREETLSRISDLCHKLATDCDIIRARYWDFVKERTRRQYTPST